MDNYEEVNKRLEYNPLRFFTTANALGTGDVSRFNIRDLEDGNLETDDSYIDRLGDE